MNIKKLSTTFLLFFAIVVCSTNLAASEKPVQHLELPDVTSIEEAKRVFLETTSELQEKNKLDTTELHEIHMITYSLEKAVAYFAGKMSGEQQTAATKMAEVVELIHLGSENNRAAETEVYLEEYFKMAKTFSTRML